MSSFNLTRLLIHTHTHTHTHIYIYIYIYIYKPLYASTKQSRNQKDKHKNCNTFNLGHHALLKAPLTRFITDRYCILAQKKTRAQWSYKNDRM